MATMVTITSHCSFVTLTPEFHLKQNDVPTHYESNFSLWWAEIYGKTEDYSSTVKLGYFAHSLSHWVGIWVILCHPPSQETICGSLIKTTRWAFQFWVKYHAPENNRKWYLSLLDWFVLKGWLSKEVDDYLENKENWLQNLCVWNI